MQKIHITFGTILFVMFIATGIFMLSSFPEIYGNSPEVRMMFRANHIYILFAALINLLLGLITLKDDSRFRKTAGRFSSVLIITGGILLVMAFFIEPSSSGWDRPLTFFGVIFHLIGIIIITLVRLAGNKKMDI